MIIATCGKDVRYFEWPQISYINSYQAPIDCPAIRTISWSCDGKMIIAVRSKGCPVLIDMQEESDPRFVAYECTKFCSTSVGTFQNNNSEFIAFGTENGNILTFDMKAGCSPLNTIQINNPIQQIEFSSDDKNIAIGCANGQIVLLDDKYKNCANFCISNRPILSTIAYCKMTPHLLAGATKEGDLHLWNTDTTDNILTAKKHTAKITDLKFFNSGVSSVGIDGKYICYDLRSSETLSCNLDCPLSSIDYLTGTYQLAISTTTGQLRSYDIRNMKSPISTFVSSGNGGFKKVAFQPDMNASYVEDFFNATKPTEDSEDSNVEYGSLAALPNNTSQNDGHKTDTPSTSNNTDNPHFEDINNLTEQIAKRVKTELNDLINISFCDQQLNTTKQFVCLDNKLTKTTEQLLGFLTYLDQKVDAKCQATSPTRSDISQLGSQVPSQYEVKSQKGSNIESQARSYTDNHSRTFIDSQAKSYAEHQGNSRELTCVELQRNSQDLICAEPEGQSRDLTYAEPQESSQDLMHAEPQRSSRTLIYGEPQGSSQDLTYAESQRSSQDLAYAKPQGSSRSLTNEDSGTRAFSKSLTRIPIGSQTRINGETQTRTTPRTHISSQAGSEATLSQTESQLRLHTGSQIRSHTRFHTRSTTDSLSERYQTEDPSGIRSGYSGTSLMDYPVRSQRGSYGRFQARSEVRSLPRSFTETPKIIEEDSEHDIQTQN